MINTSTPKFQPLSSPSLTNHQIQNHEVNILLSHSTSIFTILDHIPPPSPSYLFSIHHLQDPNKHKLNNPTRPSPKQVHHYHSNQIHTSITKHIKITLANKHKYSPESFHSFASLLAANGVYKMCCFSCAYRVHVFLMCIFQEKKKPSNY